MFFSSFKLLSQAINHGRECQCTYLYGLVTSPTMWFQVLLLTFDSPSLNAPLSWIGDALLATLSFSELLCHYDYSPLNESSFTLSTLALGSQPLYSERNMPHCSCDGALPLSDYSLFGFLRASSRLAMATVKWHSGGFRPNRHSDYKKTQFTLGLFHPSPNHDYFPK